MGGLICRDMYKEDLTPTICFMVTTPQKKVYVAGLLKRIASTSLCDRILGVSGKDLSDHDIAPAPPPCTYYTVSTSLPIFSGFDGAILTSNMMIEDENNHHIDRSSHFSILLTPELHQFVITKITEQITH